MKLVTSLALAIAVAALAAPAFADNPPGENPFPAKKVKVAMYVDTVTASKSATGFVPSKSCTQTSNFDRNEGVVFRMWAYDTKTGDALNLSRVRYVYVKIPGQPNMKLTWGKHGKLDNSPWFWSGMWTVPADYPLGVVDFQVVVKTKKNTFGVFSQAGLSDSSRLTVIP